MSNGNLKQGDLVWVKFNGKWVVERKEYIGPHEGKKAYICRVEAGYPYVQSFEEISTINPFLRGEV